MEAMDNMIDGHGVDVPVAVGVNCGEQLWEVLKEREYGGMGGVRRRYKRCATAAMVYG